MSIVRTHVDIDNRNLEEIAAYQADRIVAMQAYIKALEDELRAYRHQDWRETKEVEVERIR